jgi:hypothetical protein
VTEPPITHPKALALLDMLAKHSSVFVYLSKHVLNVMPIPHDKSEVLVLQLGLNMREPIRDLYVGNGGFRATLRFDRTYFTVTVIWSAVFGMRNQEATDIATWNEDETEIRTQLSELLAAEFTKPEQPTGVHRKLPAGWRVIEGGATSGHPPKLSA